MKNLLKVVVVLLVVLIAIAGGAYYYLDSIAKKAIEYGGTRALGVETTLQRIHLSVFGGEATLGGLAIANPAGFGGGKLLGLGSGDVAVSLGSLSGDTVTIPRVTLSGIEMNLVQKGNKSNVSPLLAKGGAPASKGQSAPAGQSAPGKKFIISHLTIQNVQVNARLELLGEASKVNLVIPKIELKDLGTAQGGLPMGELIRTVVQVVVETAANSSGSLAPQLSRLLKGDLKGLSGVKTEVIGKASAEVNKLSGDLNKQLEKVPGGAGSPVQQETDKLLKGVKGLLDKQ